MVAKILLYVGTILLYEWIVLFAGAIPNLFLGIINNSTGGRFPPFSKFAFVLKTLPAIAILFLADWIWRIAGGCSIPIVILPILAVIQFRNIRAPGANISNKYQATATVVGIILFACIHLVLNGIDDVTWFGFGSRSEQEQVSSQSGLSPELTEQLSHFKNSIDLRNKALKIMTEGKQPGYAYSLSEQDEQKMLILLGKCLYEIQSVSDNALLKLHPELPQHYRQEFHPGVQMMMNGIHNKNPDAVMKAGQLMRNFGDWYASAFQK
jgi:hypothetical protein